MAIIAPKWGENIFEIAYSRQDMLLAQNKNIFVKSTFQNTDKYSHRS